MLKLKPDSFKAHNNLGNTLLVLGRMEEAIAHFQRTLQINPDYAEAGRFGDAIRTGSKAVELAPTADKAELETRLELYKVGKPYREKT